MTTDFILFTGIDGKPIESPNKIKILDIAMELFSRKGFTGVSIRDITKEVGIKESSLYNHFRSKEELLSTIFYNFRRSIPRMLTSEDSLSGVLQTVSPELFLKQSLASYMKHIDDPVMAKVWRMIYMEQYRDPVARDIYLNDVVGDMLKSLEKIFSIWMAAGRIHTADPRILAAEYQYPLFAVIGVYVLLRVDGRSTWDIETSMREHVDYFVGKIIT